MLLSIESERIRHDLVTENYIYISVFLAKSKKLNSQVFNIFNEVEFRCDIYVFSYVLS